MGYQLPFKDGQTILEVGGGDKPLYHPNMDVRPLPNVDIVADLTAPLPVPDGEYAGVFGHYILEHTSWRAVRSFVGEVYRVLRPGGTAVFFTANTEAQMRWALEQPQDDQWMERVSQCLFGDQNYEGSDWVHNAHFVCFSPQTLVRLFLSAGFTKVEIYEHDQTPTDCIVEVTK